MSENQTTPPCPNEIEEIRARHGAAEADGRYDLSWHEDYGLAAHRDRAALLRALDHALPQVAERRETKQSQQLLLRPASCSCFLVLQ